MTATEYEYIVLRSTGDRPVNDRPIMRGSEATARSSAEVSDLEFVQLEPDEASAVAAEDDVEVVAPSLPMQLIAPLADMHAEDEGETNVEPLDDPDATWGVNAVGAADSPFGGGDIVPAIIDTGIEAGHPAFEGVDVVTRNFTTEADEDLDGHGTHCAGTVFGRPVDGLRIGVADGVNRALAAKVISSQGASTASLFNAIQWTLAEGANVISMSLGIDFPGFVKDLIEVRDIDPRVATSIALEGYTENILLYQRLTTLMKSTISFQQTATIVAAAGNESDRRNSPSVILNVAPPSAADGIRSVGAVGQTPEGLTIASFSNANPDVVGPGVSVISAALGGGVRSLNGTSMATPHVAGVTVLWADKLKKETGRLEVESLEAKVLANTSTAALAPEFQRRDIGAGMVMAPQA